MDGHDIERPDMFGAGSHHKRLWLVPPAEQPPDGFVPGSMLEFHLAPCEPGKTVRLTVFRRGLVSVTLLGEREFANSMLAVAFVQAEVACYQARGWTLHGERPPHASPSQTEAMAEPVDVGRQRRPVTAVGRRATMDRTRLLQTRARRARREQGD